MLIYHANKTIILDTIKLFLLPKEECFKKLSNVLAKHDRYRRSMCILAQGNLGIFSDHYQISDCFHSNWIISSSVAVFHFPRWLGQNDTNKKLETWKDALESTGLRINVKKKKIIVIGDKAGKIRKEEKLSFGVWRRGVSSNYFLWQFFKCTKHRRSVGIRGKLNRMMNLNFGFFKNQETDFVNRYRINLLKFLRSLNLGDTAEARGGVAEVF